MTKPKIAIVSPSANVVSETFIKAHIEGLNADVLHYYNGHLPKELAGQGRLVSYSLSDRLKRKLRPESEFDLEEQAVYDSFKKEGVQAVLAEYGPTGVRLMRICEALNIPMVVHYHGYDASQYDILERYGADYKTMFAKSAAVISVSTKMRQMLLDIGADESKLHLFPYGPHDDFLSMERRPAPDTRFLFVGRFVDKKAPYYALLAFKKALEMGVKAKLIMAGKGPLWPTVVNLRDYFGLQDHVELPGMVDHATVKRHMEESTCYLQHSIRADSGDMEGTPVSILEAAASALPIVSTKHAGIPDVIEDGVAGYLVDEHDVDAMAAAIVKIAQDPAAAQAMGDASRVRISQEFTRALNLAKIDALFQDILGIN